MYLFTCTSCFAEQVKFCFQFQSLFLMTCGQYKDMSSKYKYKPTEIDVSLRLNEWIKAVRSPPPYRVAGRSLNLNTIRLAKLGICMLLVLTVISLIIPAAHYGSELNRRVILHTKYNDTYPLSKPEKDADGHTIYKIAAIADLDTDSKHKDKKYTWTSYLKTGSLKISPNLRHISVVWDPIDIVLESHIAEKGRGMELSELVAFNGKLYTCDDRSGIVFEIAADHSISPWVILLDGNGHSSKGFKCEWMTVKDNVLWVGGLGKEWTSITGVVQNLNPQWVKSIGYTGDILNHEWVHHYNAMRKTVGYELPGYIIHESGVWSKFHKQWFFLPRRASSQTYEEQADERRATNLMFRANEDFTQIIKSHVGPLNPTHGFSSFKFIPKTNDELIVALKSEEDRGKIATYVTAFNIDGEVLMDEMKIGEHKFEGIEFV